MRSKRGFPADPIIWLIIPALLVAVLNVAHLWIQTANPVDNANPESLAVYWAGQVAEGKSLYTDFRRWPYNITSFGPVYYLTLGNAVRWFNLSQDETFIWGRRLIVACCLAIGSFIFWKGKRDTGDEALAALACLVFLSSYFLWPVAAVCRPDVLAALFSISGFLVYTSSINRRARFAALLLFGLAFFTKFSYVSAPAAIFLYQLIRKNWKEGLLFGGLYAFGVFTIAAAMHLATEGLSTLNMIVSNTGAPMRLANIRIVFNVFLQQAPLAVILAVLGFFTVTWRRPEGIYFLLSLLLAIVSSAKMGSAVNYYLEPLIAGSILVAPALHGLRELEDRARIYIRVFAAVVFWVLMLPAFNYLLHTLQTLRFRSEAQVQELVRQSPGFVLSDNARLFLVSQAPMLGDPFTLSCLETRGLWSSKELVGMLRRHQIQYVVLYMPIEEPSSWQGFKRLPASAIQIIQSEYRFLKVVDGYYVYVPRVEDGQS